MRQASSARLTAHLYGAMAIAAAFPVGHFVAPPPESRSHPAKDYTPRRSGKYMPQHGERECARRRRQMEKAALKKAGAL